MTLPEPLTPPDSSLASFPYMPLDVARLRDSDLASVASAEAFRAAVLLWCACWHQKPAASLPDDDRVLAQFAGFGRFVKEWRKVRDEALRGFIKCSDGRLYHVVVAEKAVEALGHKEAQRQRTEAARRAKLQRRDKSCDKKKQPPVTGGDFLLLQAPTEKEIESPIVPKGTAARFLDEARAVLSSAGRQRTKPKPCEKLLTAMIAKHGYDALFAATRAFYSTPEATKEDGQFQCGLQVALRDGRIEALIKAPPTTKPQQDSAQVRRDRVLDLVAGRLNWDESLDGPYPDDDELAVARGRLSGANRSTPDRQGASA